MSTEIKLPSLGEGVDEAEVLEVLVQQGDKLEPEQAIIEVETDKASAQVPCTQAGRVESVKVAAGDTIHTGDVLLTITDAESDAPEKAGAEQNEAVAEGPKSEDRNGSSVKNDDASEEDAESGGEQEQEESEDKSSEELPESKSGPTTQAATTPNRQEEFDPPTPASPAVRRFAREVGVEIDDVTGTGAGGRITRDDVKGQVAEQRTTEPPATATDDVAATMGESDSDAFGEVRVERLSKLQQTMSQRMHESWTTIPRVTNFDDADITQLEELRQTSKKDYAEEGIKLSILPLVAKAVALTLQKHPMLNAVLDSEKDEVRFKQYVNLGIAIDTERGLVVPSLRQADLLSIGEIARRVEELVELAQRNKLTREDLYGSTFTISNLGSIGGTYSTPIINPPELAILLLGRARRMRVFVDEDREEPRLMMPLSLSYDHRLIDGATAARFLSDLKTYLAAPTRLLMAP